VVIDCVTPSSFTGHLPLELSHALPVVWRLWLLLCCIGVAHRYDPTGLKGLDYVLDSAARHNITLILSFIDNWKYYNGVGQVGAPQAVAAAAQVCRCVLRPAAVVACRTDDVGHSPMEGRAAAVVKLHMHASGMLHPCLIAKCAGLVPSKVSTYAMPCCWCWWLQYVDWSTTAPGRSMPFPVDPNGGDVDTAVSGGTAAGIRRSSGRCKQQREVQAAAGGASSSWGAGAAAGVAESSRRQGQQRVVQAETCVPRALHWACSTVLCCGQPVQRLIAVCSHQPLMGVNAVLGRPARC
jgi:hypothetical protein